MLVVCQYILKRSRSKSKQFSQLNFIDSYVKPIFHQKPGLRRVEFASPNA